MTSPGARTVTARVLCVGAWLTAACQPAWSAQWTVVPRLQIGERYTDNVTLASRGGEDDFITEVTPGLSVRGEGGRVNLNLDYNLQALFFRNSSSRDQSNHQLQADATAELWKQVLFIDAESTVSQQIVSNRGRFSSSNFNVTGNRTDTVTWRVSPYLRHHLGAWADSELRYAFTRVDFGSGARVGGSDARELTVRFDSGRRFARMPWDIEVRQQDLDQEGAGTVSLDRITANVSYVINRQWRLIGTFGNEDNSFPSTSGAVDGTFWLAGAQWSPSRRTRLRVQVGDRFFGRSFSGHAEHRRRRWILTADYREDPQTTSSLVSGLRLVSLTDLAGQPVFDPVAATNIALPTDTPSITSEVFVHRRLDVRLSYAGRRSRLSGGIAWDERSFQVTRNDETVQRLDVRWSHDLTRRLSAGWRGSWQSTDFGGARGSDDRLTAGLFMRYRLGASIDVLADYRYEDVSSDAGNEFTQNVVSASVNLHL